jgi:hypothetical protein
MSGFMKNFAVFALLILAPALSGAILYGLLRLAGFH